MGCIALSVGLLIGLGGCVGEREDSSAGRAATGANGYEYPAAPKPGHGRLDPAVENAVRRLTRSVVRGKPDAKALTKVASSGDPRLAWLISDYLRFSEPGQQDMLVTAFMQLTGVDPSRDATFADSAWLSVTNHLIAWDLSAPPGYRKQKGKLFLEVEPGWRPFFEDANADIDWRLISWGGVPIDDRPPGDPNPCPLGCIPALDDPALTRAAKGDWYPNGRRVFGVEVGGEAVAFPKNIMEVHEMVNVTIGGRRLGIPYCTLCGSAQAYFLDAVPQGVRDPVLRTSGLLSRSNKVMYDLRTRSAIDTFTGRALSGPLQDAHVQLKQTSVVSSTWGKWKRDHPDTKIVAQDGGIGRLYSPDPLEGRDDDGPIFPIGDADPRLPVQAEVVGVIAPGGRPVAFPREQALSALDAGEPVRMAGVRLTEDGNGLLAHSGGGRELAAHQAFWFAWSQFHPRTRLWSAAGA